MRFVSGRKRSHYCGEITVKDVEKTAVVMGWVDRRRDHGGLVFIDLRDTSGILQVMIDPTKAGLEIASDLRAEFVVAFAGQVTKRPDGMENEHLPTGQVELIVEQMEILSKAATPPFQAKDKQVSEPLRLKYRYLDLRSERLQRNLKIRHHLMQSVRTFLSGQRFFEIETPILYKSTPEGARDFLVPSRVSVGNFYALPQSPQTLKQLLMISGFDRYFQIARCFRDEDLRADRQPEFSQIDIEMSFVDMEDVIDMNEKLARHIWKEALSVDLGKIPRLTFFEALNRYGSDKPDLRTSVELVDLAKTFAAVDFKVFSDVLKRGGSIKGFLVKNGASYTRARFDKLTEVAKSHGAKGMVWLKWESETDQVSSPISKFLDQDTMKSAFRDAQGGKGDSLLIVADDWEIACVSAGALRLDVAKTDGLLNKDEFKFLWVTEFPLLEYDAGAQRWAARHHPFTAPTDDTSEILLNHESSRFSELKAKAYDLVCNGNEIAGGSVRIYDSNIQAAMFKALGMGPEDVERQFGFFIEALKYGTPPHGGMAWGLDRLAMIVADVDAIRDVIAFPKTAKATDLMASSPSAVATDQLLELGIRLISN